MALIKTSTALKSFTRRTTIFTARQSCRPFSSTFHARSTQGYGDGKGDPKGENPQEQGSSNATKHNAEHPGPEPPSEGQNTGAGPTKGGSGKSPADASAQSGGARSKEAKETGSSPTGGSVGKSGGKGGFSVLQDNHKSGQNNTKEQDAEVEQHNREFEKGHDRAYQSSNHDKVDSKFWKGHGGADRQP